MGEAPPPDNHLRITVKVIFFYFFLTLNLLSLVGQVGMQRTLNKTESETRKSIGVNSGTGCVEAFRMTVVVATEDHTPTQYLCWKGILAAWVREFSA